MEFVELNYRTVSWLLTVMAVDVFLSGVRDLIASFGSQATEESTVPV